MAFQNIVNLFSKTILAKIDTGLILLNFSKVMLFIVKKVVLSLITFLVTLYLLGNLVVRFVRLELT